MIYHIDMSLRPIDFAVLDMLRFRPMSGYEIKGAYERGPANFMPISYGQIYPVLAKLRRQKLVTAEKKPGTRGSLPFSITASGEEALRQWLLTSTATSYRELLLRLFFASKNELPMLDRAISQFREQEQAQLSAYADTGKWLNEVHGTNPHLPVWKLVMEYGVLQ